MKSLLLAAVAATVSFASGAQAADVQVVIREGVQTLPFEGPTGPILAYDDVGEHGNAPNNTGSTFVSKAAARNGNGSLEIHGDRSRYVIGNIYGTTDPLYGAVAASQSLTKFSDLTSLTFDWRVNTPTVGTFAHSTPAVRIHIIDNGVRSEMIWEGVYNGGVAGQTPATGVWQSADADDLFYLNVRSNAATFQTQNPGFTVSGSGVVFSNGSQVNRTVGNWQSLFSANAYVTGLSFGAGSGFGGQFVGFVDNVGIRSPNGNNFVVNFEAVPEPATWAMMIGGFGFIGAAARRRSAKVTFA